VNIHIRDMQVEDLDAVHHIDELSFSLPWTLNSFRFELLDNPTSHLWVADVEDENGLALAGMLVLWMIVDEGHIATFAVHPKYRRLGIGRALIEHAIASARAGGLTRIFLEVRRSNIAAQELYQAYGFVVDGVRPRYYRDTMEDALMMTLNLAGNA